MANQLGTNGARAAQLSAYRAAQWTCFGFGMLGEFKDQNFGWY
jgi:hypothetical protein